MTHNLASFTDVLSDDNISQPISLPSSTESNGPLNTELSNATRPRKGVGQKGELRSIQEIDTKYRDVFTYPFFNIVQSRVLEDALYSDKSMVVCAPTGSGKTVIFEMAIVRLLMELEDKCCNEDFKIIYMAPVKALCTEKLTEWYPKFTKLGLLCIEVTGDTDVDFSQLKPYRLIITTPEKWDMLTRRWRDHKSLVEVVKLFLIDEVHILNDETRGPVLEAVVSRMKTIESSAQSDYRIEQLQKEMQGGDFSKKSPPSIRFVAVSATVSNPEDVAAWLGTDRKPAVFYKFGDECRPVKLNRVVEGYPCTEGTSIFKFDIILNYKLWPVIQKYHRGKPTLIFCNTRKSVLFTAETLSRELTVTFNPEQKAKLTALASTLKNKKLQTFVLSGVGCHHAGLLYEERTNIERAFRNRDLPILITTTTLAMGVNLPAHLVIIKNTQQYVNGAYQEYSISTVLQMMGRAGRPQFDTEATAVIMTRAVDKHRYQALVGGSEPLQSYLHKRLAENLNSEAALGTVGDVAQCVQWLRSTFLFVRAAKDPKRYLGLPQNSPPHLISKKIEELCVKAMNGLASSGLITMDDASCIQSTEAGRLMSIFYLDLETMKLIMKIQGTETIERLLWLICESHELADMHLRVDERRCLNALNRNNTAVAIRFPMKGKINSRQMKLNCVIQAILGCLHIPDPSLGQEAMKIMRIADRVCKCLVSYVTRPDLITQQPEFYTALLNTIVLAKCIMCPSVGKHAFRLVSYVTRPDLITHQPEFYTALLNTIVLAKCISAHLWENSHFVSRQLKGIGPTFSTLLASAGKVNFMLLEESHPRDLERIMNKGPPAGNVLRKQISLLPKYQLTISPIDEKTVTLQLVLLNHSHLIENMDQLTAGESHKSYIIVGDSYNHILLLTSFKDKDLMCVYDGIIKYDIKRKHNFEHKIFAHCISSSFVGVDVQSEYLFNDLEHLFGNTVINAETQPKKSMKQKCITDTFKERKRKGTNDNDITQSKEKKKRDNNIMEKFKSLKESFEYNTSKDYKVHLEYPKAPARSSLSSNNSSSIEIDSTNKPTVTNADVTKNNVDDENDDYDIDDDKIDSLLKEIENEISKSRPNQNDAIDKSKALIASETSSFNNHLSIAKNDSNIKSDKGTSFKRKYKPAAHKSNYNFIDLLEKNTDLSDEEDPSRGPSKYNGFSETIKSHINQYLQVTETKTKASDKNLELLLEDPEININRNNFMQSEASSTETVKDNFNVPDDIVQYTIKEILEPKITKPISNVNMTKHYEISNVNFVESTPIDNKQQEHLNINDTNNAPRGLNISDERIKTNEENVTYHQIEELEHDTVVKNSKENAIDPYIDEVESDVSNKLVNFNNQEIFELNKKDEARPNSLVPLTAIYDNQDSIVQKNTPVKDIRREQDITSEHVLPYFKSGLLCIEDVKKNTPKQKNITNTFNVLRTTENCNTENFVSQQFVHSKGFLEDIEKETDLIKNSHDINPLDELKKSVIRVDTNRSNEIIPYENRYLYNNYSSDIESAQLEYVLCRDHVNKPTTYVPPNNSEIRGNHYNEVSSSNYKPKFTPEVTTLTNRDECVNKYSYSATKIDVCTKTLPEHSIHLIRKVKLDVDITEIISRKKDVSSDGLPMQVNNNTREFKRMETGPFYHGLPNIKTDFTQVTPVNRITVAPTSPIMQKDNNVMDKPQQGTKHSVIALKYLDDLNKELNESMILNSSKGIDTICLEKENDKTQNDQRTFAEVNKRNDNLPLQHNIDVGNADKTVKNILQKYSKILGTETPKKEVIKDNTPPKRPDCTKSQKLKPNRPFKIGDINKFNVMLPNDIISGTAEDQPSESEETVSTEDVIQKLHIREEQRSPMIYKPIPEVVIQEDEASNDYLEEVTTAVDIDSESNEDFNLDQTMLDPKTLLQSVIGEEELIPPPPEFRDDTNCPQEFEHEYLEQIDESIFDNDTATELTPSKEIETWTLSSEDSWDHSRVARFNSPQSFTMMRKNAPDIHEGPMQDGSLPRRARLGKFKFDIKSKLRVKK